MEAICPFSVPGYTIVIVVFTAGCCADNIIIDSGGRGTLLVLFLSDPNFLDEEPASLVILVGRHELDSQQVKREAKVHRNIIRVSGLIMHEQDGALHQGGFV